MRFITSLTSLILLACGGWYAWENVPFVRDLVHKGLGPAEFRTLEIHHTAEEIMQNHKTELLKKKGYTYLDPKLMFYPYLLMNVKYAKDGSTTDEGILLWGLTDAEMVLNTATWEKTHGFEDCVNAKANKNDFKLIQAIAEHKGALDREGLYQKLKVEPEVLDDWIESCRLKKLVVTHGNKFRLHFQNPHLSIHPITHLDQSVVTQPIRYSVKMKQQYSVTQIRKLAQTVYGSNFAIRNAQEVFLPVYSISVQNPDGSVLTTYWNALNGKRLHAG